MNEVITLNLEFFEAKDFSCGECFDEFLKYFNEKVGKQFTFNDVEKIDFMRCIFVTTEDIYCWTNGYNYNSNEHIIFHIENKLEKDDADNIWQSINDELKENFKKYFNQTEKSFARDILVMFGREEGYLKIIDDDEVLNDGYNKYLLI